MEETKAHKIIKWIIFSFALALNLFILFNAFIPGAQSSQESGFVVNLIANFVNSIKEGTINSSNYDDFATLIRKLIGNP